MKQKIFKAPIQLKADGEEGEFTAVFARLNVIDHHGDVTVPGAFMDGQAVKIEPWNHGWTLPAGRGEIHSDKEKAWVDGRFFLDTEVGRENYRTVKNLGDLAEWSYTFYVEENEAGEFEKQQVNFLKRLDVVGVGPVTRGAGIDTGTVVIKAHGSEPESEDADMPSDEGQRVDESDPEPSGVGVAVIRAELEILEMEIEHVENN